MATLLCAADAQARDALEFSYGHTCQAPRLENGTAAISPTQADEVSRDFHCGGRREVLKCITDPKVIDRILTHLGLKTVLPEVAPARAPPGSELLFEY